MPQKSEEPKAQRRWFFQINVNTGDEVILGKIREAIENLKFLDDTAAITERTMMCKLVDSPDGEVFVQDREHNYNVQ